MIEPPGPPRISTLAFDLREISRRISRRGFFIPGGSIIFEGKGSVDAVRQALREVAQQVGSKVCGIDVRKTDLNTSTGAGLDILHNGTLTANDVSAGRCGNGNTDGIDVRKTSI
jgi:hypothetical protein